MVKLECKSPVPSDIDIAQAATPVHISDIAKAAGLRPEEYDLYGTTKAKVECECLWQHYLGRSIRLVVCSRSS